MKAPNKTMPNTIKKVFKKLIVNLKGCYRIIFWEYSGWYKNGWKPSDMTDLYWRGF